MRDCIIQKKKTTTAVDYARCDKLDVTFECHLFTSVRCSLQPAAMTVPVVTTGERAVQS